MATARIEIGNITEIEKNGKTIFQRNVLIVRDSGILFYDRLISRDRASIEIYTTPPEENMTEHAHEMEPTAEIVLETPTDTIRTMELEALQLTADLAKTHEMAKDIKTKVVLAVETEWEETQDKALSNATKRNTAVEITLNENETYAELNESAKIMDHRIREFGIEISFQKRQFKIEVGSTDDLRLITAALQEIAAAQRSTADNLSLLTTR